MCNHQPYDICLPCFVAFHDLQIVEKDYCILLQVGTENWYSHISDKSVSTFTPCLTLLEQVYYYRYKGKYKDHLLIIPFDKEHTTYNKNTWPGIKRKAIKLIKETNIKNLFLANRLK